MSDTYDISHTKISASELVNMRAKNAIFETVIDYESYICEIDILNMVIERFLNFERTSSDDVIKISL